jgi:hypothetical protein
MFPRHVPPEILRQSYSRPQIRSNFKRSTALNQVRLSDFGNPMMFHASESPLNGACDINSPILGQALINLHADTILNSRTYV